MSRPIRATAAAALTLLSAPALLPPAASALPDATLAGACTITWNGSTSTDWDDPLNWTPTDAVPARVPDAGDDVCVGTAGDFDPVVAHPVTLASLFVDGSAAEDPATLTASGADTVLETTGGVTLGADGVLELAGTGSGVSGGPVANGGVLRLTATSAALAAPVDNAGSVVVAPGATAALAGTSSFTQRGSLDLSGDLVAPAGTTLRIEGGTMPGGPAALDGGALVYATIDGDSTVVARGPDLSTVSGTMAGGHTLDVAAQVRIDTGLTSAGTITIERDTSMIGDPLTTTGQLTVAGTYNAAGQLTVGAGGVVDLPGNGLLSPGSGVTLDGGTLQGSGDVENVLSNAGTVAPSAGETMAIEGVYIQTATGRLVMRTDSKLEGSNAMALGGELIVTAATETPPELCATFDLVTGGILNTWASVSGSWDGGPFVQQQTRLAAGVFASALPGAPRRVTATARDGAATLGVTPPSAIPCDPVTAFAAHFEPVVPGAAPAVDQTITEQSGPRVGGLVNQVPYTVTVKSVNLAGASALSSPPVVVKPNAPPVAGFVVVPDPPQVGQAATFTSTARDRDTSVAPRLEWDLDGDGFDDGTEATVTRTYEAAGPVAVRIRATDGDGATTVTTRTLDVGGQPVPTPTPDPSPTASPSPEPPAAPQSAVAATLDGGRPNVAIDGSGGVRVSASRVLRLTLSNANPFPVAARATLRSTTATFRATKRRRLGAGTVTLPAAGAAALKVKLSRAARKLVVSRRRVKATLTIVLTGPGGGPVTITHRVTVRAANH